MAKYIRTKEKVYEVVEENERYYKCCYDDGCITLAAKFDNDVNGFSKALKTADTINDLCDRFVLLERNLKPRIFETLKGAINNKIYDDEVVYGAIWTDEGLIYIAKMNDKGELELI